MENVQTCNHSQVCASMPVSSLIHMMLPLSLSSVILGRVALSLLIESIEAENVNICPENCDCQQSFSNHPKLLHGKLVNRNFQCTSTIWMQRMPERCLSNAQDFGEPRPPTSHRPKDCALCMIMGWIVKSCPVTLQVHPNEVSHPCSPTAMGAVEFLWVMSRSCLQTHASSVCGAQILLAQLWHLTTENATSRATHLATHGFPFVRHLNFCCGGRKIH